MKIMHRTISKRWIISLLAVIALLGGGYLYLNSTQIAAQEETATADTATQSTVPIQPASAIVGAVSAAGHIELVSQQSVAPDVGGVVNQIAVDVGDQVKAGDLLFALETTELERALRRAELAVQAQQNALAQLSEEADAAEIASAQANLAQATENLADVQAGPSDEEIAAARSKLSSAWATYSELQAGASEAELTQLSADLRRAEVALAEAQTAYDKVAWRKDVGMTTQAAELQTATIDNEAAQAAYEEATAPAETSSLQSALGSAQDAQATLDDLLNSPTPAEIAVAEASVADAEAQLQELLTGPSGTEIQEAQIALEQALVDLEEAHVNLAAAKVTAPVDGTVLQIDVELGQQVSQGEVIVTLADPQQLELTIDVAEVDITQVTIDQPVEIEVDAFSGRTFQGVVESVAPAGDTSDSVVSYPVTIRLTDDSLAGVLPGMTAVATIVNAEAASGGWLVPTSSIRQDGDAAVVMVVRGESTVSVTVVPGAVQGEWTIVQAPELQAGDEVVGDLTSYIDESQQFRGPGAGPVGGPPPGDRP